MKEPIERVDIELICVEQSCKQPFTFKAGEQEYYEQNGLFPPKRCPMCRAKRKAQREAHNAT